MTIEQGKFRVLIAADVRPAILSNPTNGWPGLVEDGVHYLNRRREDYVDGRHYVDYIEAVKQLKREERYAELESLITSICVAMETGDQNGGVAPWWYEQLAIAYKKQGRTEDEIAILERYERQKHAPGARPSRIANRLAKLRANAVIQG